MSALGGEADVVAWHFRNTASPAWGSAAPAAFGTKITKTRKKTERMRAGFSIFGDGATNRASNRPNPEALAA